MVPPDPTRRIELLPRTAALAQDIREGGRYIYSANPKLAAKFTSRYRTAAVKRTRGKKGKRGESSAADATASPALA